MKYLIFTIASLLGALLASAQPFTLQQCIDSALLHNNTIKQQTYQYETQRINYQQARQNLLPNVSASANQSWVFGRSIGADNIYQSANSMQTNFGLSANLLLFDGLRMKYNIDQTKATMLQSEANVEAVKADIMMNVSAMYLQVLLCKELTKVAADQLADTQLKLEKNRALVLVNRLAEGELLALEAQASKEELNLIQQQNNLQLALLELAQAIELEQFQGFDIVVPKEEELLANALTTNDQVYQQALLNRPEIRAAEQQLTANQYALKSAKSGYYPTLSVGGNVGTSYYNLKGLNNNNSFQQQLGDNLSSSVGLSLQVPIFNQMQTSNSVKRAKLTIENSKVEVENVKKTLRKNIDQAYYNALAARSREEAANKSQKSSLEAYRYAEQKYQSGRASVYEMYDAKNSYTAVLSEQIQAKYDYYFKLKILEYYSAPYTLL